MLGVMLENAEVGTHSAEVPVLGWFFFLLFKCKTKKFSMEFLFNANSIFSCLLLVKFPLFYFSSNYLETMSVTYSLNSYLKRFNMHLEAYFPKLSEY